MFEKDTQLVARALVAIRKKKKLAKVKPQHWHILVIWKRSNKIKVVKAGFTLKVLCHWPPQISELLLSAMKILRWLVGLKLIQFEKQKTQLPFIILAKILKPILCGVIKGT